MKLSIGKKLTIGFAIVIICLITISLVSYFAATKLDETSKWKLQSRQVLLGLDAIIIRLVNAEAGQRGYLITGEEDYLKPYNEALEKLSSRIGELRELTKDNPVQQANLDKLEPLITQKTADLAGVFYLRKEKGFDEAKAAFTGDTGEKLMTSIRKQIDQMNDEEIRLLKKRELAAQAAKKLLDMVCLFGTLLALLLSAIVVLVINWSITKPIMKLTEVADAISKGDTKISELKVVSDDEIGRLTESFNRMSASIKLLLEEGKKQ